MKGKKEISYNIGERATSCRLNLEKTLGARQERATNSTLIWHQVNNRPGSH